MAKKQDQIDWKGIANSSEFKQLLSNKKKFVIPWVLFFLVFYYTLPICTSYFTFLNEKAIGSLNWAYLFAFAQFLMTWTLCLIYARKANQFDESVAKIKAQAGQANKKQPRSGVTV